MASASLGVRYTVGNGAGLLQTRGVRTQAIPRSSIKPSACLRSERLQLQKGLFADTRSLSSSKTCILRQAPPRRRLSLGRPQCVTATPTSSTTSANTISWGVQLYVHGIVKNAPLTIKVVDADTGKESGEPISVSKFEVSNWERQPSSDGTILTGALPLPADIKNPGAVILKYTGPATKKPLSDAVYVSEVVLSVPGKNVTFSAHSWVHQKHVEGRVFFEGEGRLPSQTPQALKPLRQKELDIIKGVGSPDLNATRTVGDRIVSYDVYNDLGNLKQADGIRPTLGGKGKGPASQYAYPRRIATNRPKTADGLYETAPSGETWIPQDDMWDPTKSSGFLGDKIFSVLPTAATIISGAAAPPFLRKLQKFLGKGILWTIVNAILQLSILTPVWGILEKKWPEIFDKDYASWATFDDVDQVFNPDSEENIANRVKVQSGADVKEEAVALADDVKNALLNKKGTSEGDGEPPESLWQEIVDARNDLFTYKDPYVHCGRNEAWTTDEEFGRQYLAGQNPFTLKALTALPVAPDSILSADAVKPFLEGHDLNTLVADAASGSKPRVFYVDYWEPYKTYAYAINNIGGGKIRHQYAGRALLYIRNDGRIVPVGIELWSAPVKPTDDPAGTVTLYTPNDAPYVWLLAKTAFNSLDSGVHQLVSHWLRCHACTEPYQLSTYRNLSTMHPVYKFILPHFLFTLRINGNARTSLINAGGVIEEGFTPGKYALQLSAVAYDVAWRFDKEALPADLVSRGLAKEGPNGLELLVDDAPYAEDAVLIWDAIDSWATDYVNEYYKDDAAVLEDEEIQAWWNEIRTVGHEDKKEGWIELNSRASLARILATISWVTSGHHAAVNFGQYDYSAYPLNRTALIRRPIPAPGTPDYEELSSAKKSVAQGAFLKCISNPFPALLIMTTVEVLSSHAENEHYLSDPDHGLLYDGAAIQLHQKFVAKIKAAEAEIKNRNNQSSAKPTRKKLSGGRGGLPYTLLVPSSGKGVTGQGIPYSISI